MSVPIVALDAPSHSTVGAFWPAFKTPTYVSETLFGDGTMTEIYFFATKLVMKSERKSAELAEHVTTA
jgi:hypothetical protein